MLEEVARRTRCRCVALARRRTARRVHRMRSSTRRAVERSTPTSRCAPCPRSVAAVVAGLAAAAAIAVGFVLASPPARRHACAPPIATLADSHGAARVAAVGSRERPGADRGDTWVDGAAAVRRKLLLAGGASVSSSWRSRWPPARTSPAATPAPSGPASSTKPVTRWSRRHSTASSWSSGTTRAGRTARQMEVRQHAGMVEVVNADRTVASDASRSMLDGQAWTMLARAKGAAPCPTHRGKYEVVRSAGPGDRGPGDDARTRRSATAMSSSACSCSDATGVGAAPRSARRRRRTCRARSRSCGVDAVSEPSAPPSTAASHPGPARSTTSPVRTAIPRVSGNGYRLLGRWQHGNDLAQLYYTDGVLSVSVFEQPGQLDWCALPEGGDRGRGRADGRALPLHAARRRSVGVRARRCGLHVRR